MKILDGACPEPHAAQICILDTPQTPKHVYLSQGYQLESA